jgi:hypothetical protein
MIDRVAEVETEIYLCPQSLHRLFPVIPQVLGRMAWRWNRAKGPEFHATFHAVDPGGVRNDGRLKRGVGSRAPD